MIRVVKASEHFHDKISWLETRWHFSFGHYYDESNQNWSVLRVFNDDVVQPHSGFPFHAHANMEIVTYMLSGTLTHEDNLGNKGTIGANEVQRMTAGTGILHSEYNHADEEASLFQMWLLPAERKLKPSWEQRSFMRSDKENKLCCIVSPKGEGNALRIHQDVKMYASILDAGKSLSHSLEGKWAYVCVAEGELEVNGHPMHAKDAARIRDEEKLTFTAKKDTHFIVWELPPEKLD